MQAFLKLRIGIARVKLMNDFVFNKNALKRLHI